MQFLLHTHVRLTFYLYGHQKIIKKLIVDKIEKIFIFLTEQPKIVIKKRDLNYLTTEG